MGPENLLKFFVNKNTIKNVLSFPLTSISGNLSTYPWQESEEKKKLPMQEPFETIIICAQQSFEIIGGLNPIQIEIEDDRIVNMFKKRKNVTYKLTLLGILFPTMNRILRLTRSTQ